MANRVAQKAVDVTLEIARAEIRAYMNVHGAKAEYFGGDDKYILHLRFMCEIRNTGSGPALNVCQWAGIFKDSSFHPE